MWVEAAWDSSLHESHVLNCVTSERCKVGVEFDVTVSMEDVGVVSFVGTLFVKVCACDRRELIKGSSVGGKKNASLFSAT